MEPTAEALIDGALRAARAGDWATYRLRFAALSDGCAALIEQHEELRQHFETLGAAAPQYDPEGCVTEFEALATLLRTRHAGALRAWRRQLPAPLYALLRERGFTYSGAPRADGAFELLIERS